VGDGFKPYLPTADERKQLGIVVDALAEPVSKVAGVIAKK
jgi:iron uptake system component EfeO